MITAESAEEMWRLQKYDNEHSEFSISRVGTMIAEVLRASSRVPPPLTSVETKTTSFQRLFAHYLKKPISID